MNVFLSGSFYFRYIVYVRLRLGKHKDTLLTTNNSLKTAANRKVWIKKKMGAWKNIDTYDPNC